VNEAELRAIRERDRMHNARVVWDDGFGFSDCMQAAQDRKVLLEELDELRKTLQFYGVV
jgi:hypothetical protein